MKKSQEVFDPSDPKYKQTADLPEEHRDDFVDVEGGGFVKKEAAETFDNTKIAAEVVIKLKEKNIDPLDILQEEAVKEDMERDEEQERVKKLKDDFLAEFRSGERIKDLLDRFRMLEELHTDKDIVLEVVKRFWPALQYVSEDLRNDREVVLAALGSLEDSIPKRRPSARSLQYASEELRDDKEVVLEAVRRNGQAIQFASGRLQRDPDVIAAAIEENPAAINNIPHPIREEIRKLLEK